MRKIENINLYIVTLFLVLLFLSKVLLAEEKEIAQKEQRKQKDHLIKMGFLSYGRYGRYLDDIYYSNSIEIFPSFILSYEYLFGKKIGLKLSYAYNLYTTEGHWDLVDLSKNSGTPKTFAKNRASIFGMSAVYHLYEDWSLDPYISTGIRVGKYYHLWEEGIGSYGIGLHFSGGLNYFLNNAFFIGLDLNYNIYHYFGKDIKTSFFKTKYKSFNMDEIILRFQIGIGL